ncbi:hypothetical protein ABWED_0234 [Acinetobacter lwoffii]|nr:hypothetical protein ABVS_1214 [Acinetobacter lwoffii]UVA99578.1 hypothetical protein ABWED_0234 [Acinetobacter lwoffii]
MGSGSWPFNFINLRQIIDLIQYKKFCFTVSQRQVIPCCSPELQEPSV